MAQLCTISKAKSHLLELSRKNQELGESFILLRDGEPVSVLVPFDEYESLLETLDIVESEPDIRQKLKHAQEEIAKGRFKVWGHKIKPKKLRVRFKKH